MRIVLIGCGWIAEAVLDPELRAGGRVAVDAPA
jgi:hypothetical protein